MKNDYNKKKRIAIITLSTIAVCLAGGLMWYMGTLGNTQTPATQGGGSDVREAPNAGTGESVGEM